MKRIAFAALAAASLVLTACGGGNSQCKDEATSTAYAQKWGEDMQKAMAAGKITAQQVQDGMKDMVDEMSSVGNDYAAGCAKLDEIRKKIGF